ncbi:hypothetical protein ACIQWR_21770 [Streptomyces sp. NPDC098789]|uniref:HalD/BesD family halogenase n=1 Tax=Streptomyces sp. NPDC098789 TaxID=3366098 RepID=UPI00380D989E
MRLRRVRGVPDEVARRRPGRFGRSDVLRRTGAGRGGQVEHSELIPRLYEDEGLLALVSRLTGRPAAPVPDPLERHVLNILHRVGDTHGAHTDDYPYALVLFLEAPEHPADGGLAQFTPHTTVLRDVDDERAATAHHAAGDAYLLRSDTTAHRVTPLTRPGVRRTVLNFAYTTPGSQPEPSRSAGELYG